MRIYTVHELSGAPVDGDGIVLVHEGFSWPALFAPLIWLVYQRLWLALLLYAVATSVLMAAAGAVFNDTAIVIIAFAVQFGFAVFANDVRRWTLALRGYDEAGVVTGRNLVEAEREFFRHWQGPSRPAPRSMAVARTAAPGGGAVWPRRPLAADHGPIGLFPNAGA